MTKKEFYEKLGDRLQQEIWGDEAELKLCNLYCVLDCDKQVGNNMSARDMVGALEQKIKINEDRLDIINNI